MDDTRENIIVPQKTWISHRNGVSEYLYIISTEFDTIGNMLAHDSSKTLSRLYIDEILSIWRKTPNNQLDLKRPKYCRYDVKHQTIN